MSRKSLRLLFATVPIVAILLMLGVPHLKTADMRKEADNPWLPTWKNTWKYPYEPFVAKNHTPSVCVSDLPCRPIPPGTPKYISDAVANWTRYAIDIWEDENAKPQEVLTFVGVKPGDKVVDLLPGQRLIGMYWSRILYNVVGDEGRVFPFIPAIGCRAAHVSGCMPIREYTSSSNGYGHRPQYTLLGDPRWNGVDIALDMEHLTAFRNLYVMEDVAGQFSIPQQADVIWSTSHWHAFHGKVYDVDMQDFLTRMFESMSSGGTLVIADYASAPGAGFTQVDTLHRIDKEAVKAEVAKYGWTFDSESNLWAKKDDDHTKIVPEEARPGTADMFILKFKKPLNSPPSRRESRQEMAPWLDGNYSNANSLKGGAGTWHNADYTGTEGNIVKSWYMDATGALCERQEWDPISDGIIGCHYERDRILAHKLGDTWEQRTEFATDDPNATGFRAPYLKGLMPFHTYPPRPQGCTFPSCKAYWDDDNLDLGHMR